MTAAQVLAADVVKVVLASKKKKRRGIDKGDLARSFGVGAATGMTAKTVDFPFTVRSRAEEFSRPSRVPPRGGPAGRAVYRVLGIPKGRKVRWGPAANRILASELAGSVAKGMVFVSMPALLFRHLQRKEKGGR